MNETDKSALSLVPYAPERRKNAALRSFFESRKRMYLFFSLFFAFFFFFGYSLGMKSSPEKVLLYESYFKKWLPVMTLASYLSSFTIFSPVLSIFMFSGVCTFLAFIFSHSSIFDAFFISIIIMISVVYFTELYLCYDRAKYGVRQIFKARSVISVSCMTIIFLLSTLLLSGLL